jgi:hypothetical protein
MIDIRRSTVNRPRSALRMREKSAAAIPVRPCALRLATPHIGHVSHGLYKRFYEDTVLNIRKWIEAH